MLLITSSTLEVLLVYKIFMTQKPLQGLSMFQGILQQSAAAGAAAKSLQSCPTLCDPMDGSPPGSPGPWDSPGKSTGVGCHFLLQCMKVKSESEVAQSCPTLHDPMDCILPDSSVHGIFQARALEWGAIAFLGTELSCINKRMK